jgi:Tfp pilus assembly protein PilP
MAKKKISKFQRFVVIASALIVVQIGLLTYFRAGPEPKSISASINDAVQKKGFTDPRKREQSRVLLAVQSYRAKEKHLPKTLQELVPIYLDKVPIDPGTGKPFEYRIDGNKFQVGDGESAKKDSDGSATDPSEQQRKELLAVLTPGAEGTPFVYDKTGKRDPFLPFDFSPQETPDPNKPELERYSLNQLELTAVLASEGEPIAIVENGAGRGFNVRIGTRIGTEKGVVAEIQKDKLIVVEESVDFTGTVKTRRIEMPIRSKVPENEKGTANKKRRR